jgi:ERF superfamily
MTLVNQTSAADAAQVMPAPAPIAKPVTPMEMLSRALEGGAGIEVLEKLMDLQERWEARQARRAFDEAIAAAKAEIKPIVRNREGHNAKKYADFAAIAAAVDPVLSRHGLAYRFRTSQTDKIAVTCIVTGFGHYEENTLIGLPDATGSKNAIQAIGSALTYLQRYSLMQALGLAASHDDDGHAAGEGELISTEQLGELSALAQAVGADIPKFCKVLRAESLSKIPASQYEYAMSLLKTKRKAQ